MDQSYDQNNSIRYELQAFNYDTNFNLPNEIKANQNSVGTTWENSSFIKPNFVITNHHVDKKQISNTTLSSNSFFPKKINSQNNSQIVPKQVWNQKQRRIGKFGLAKSICSASQASINPKTEPNDADSENNDFRKSKCGLRDLSHKVKEIVNEFKKTTYKDVAKQLVLNFRNQINAKVLTPEQEKEQKNIKRRAYDALNVLISSGVLLKKQKFVYSTQQSKLKGKKLNQNFQEMKSLQKQYELKLKSKQNKLQALQSLFEKYTSLKKLVYRNKKNQTKREEHQNRPLEINKYLCLHEQFNGEESQAISLKQEPQKIFFFPLINLRINLQSTEILFTLNDKNTQLKIESQNSIKLQGDMDLVRLLPLIEKEYKETEMQSEIKGFLNLIKKVHHRE